MGHAFRNKPPWKLHPGMDAQNGTQFPLGARCGKRVPESASKTGYSFRMRALGETASRSEPGAVGATSLSNRKEARRLHRSQAVRLLSVCPRGVWNPAIGDCGFSIIATTLANILADPTEWAGAFHDMGGLSYRSK